MASEYLLKKYKDVKPEEPKELTPKEKRANWWHYHRIHFVIGAVVLLLLAGYIKDVFMKVEPDYQIALVGNTYLDAEVQQALEARLAELGEDRDGDGQVIVQLNSYIINEEDPTAYTVQVSLVGDISVGLSEFFLVDDPVTFQNDYGVFTMSDGSIFDEGMDADLCIRHAWQDCPALNDIDLGADLYIAQRVYTQEDDIEAHADADNLWKAMTAGAAASAD